MAGGREEYTVLLPAGGADDVYALQVRHQMRHTWAR
jgi:hypothetical protein